MADLESAPLHPTSNNNVQLPQQLGLPPPPPPSHTVDDDPGNSIPFRLRKDAPWFRKMFASFCLVLGIIVITTPKTFLRDAQGGIRWPHLIPGVLFLFAIIATHSLVVGSDPGYLDVDAAIIIREEQAQHLKELTPKQRKEKKKRDGMEPVKQKQHRPTTGILLDSDKESSDESDDSVSINKMPSLRRIVSVPATTRRRKGDTGSKSPTHKISSSSSSSAAAVGGGNGGSSANGHGGVSSSYASSDEETGRRLVVPSNNNNAEDIDGDNDDDDDDDTEPNEHLDTKLSGVPTALLPVRAKYCRPSRKVVATYDHHCSLLNTTIGERNRARFWVMLLVGTFALLWCVVVIHSGFHDAPTDEWVERNFHALVASLVFWILLVSVFFFCLFHTFLLSANLTTYEFLRSDSVGYLTHTRDFDLPFSMGLLDNWKFYFLSDSLLDTLSRRITGISTTWKPHIWIRPTPELMVVGGKDSTSTKACANVWENKYWSCC